MEAQDPTHESDSKFIGNLGAVDIKRRGVEPLDKKSINVIMMRADMSTYQNLIDHCSSQSDFLIPPKVKVPHIPS